MSRATSSRACAEGEDPVGKTPRASLRRKAQQVGGGVSRREAAKACGRNVAGRVGPSGRSNVDSAPRIRCRGPNPRRGAARREARGESSGSNPEGERNPRRGLSSESRRTAWWKRRIRGVEPRVGQRQDGQWRSPASHELFYRQHSVGDPNTTRGAAARATVLVELTQTRPLKGNQLRSYPTASRTAR